MAIQEQEFSQSTGLAKSHIKYHDKLSQKEYIEQIAYNAFSYGFVPIPIRGKIPIVEGWTNFRNNSIDDHADIISGKYPKNVRRVGNLVQSELADNVGIVTGEASGVVVIDVDVVDNGIGIWNELVDTNSPSKAITETFTIHTPSGGRHYYFKYTTDLIKIGNINRIYQLPFNYRTNGGMVVYPGSTDKQGNSYTVSDGYVPSLTELGEYNIIIAEMPTWLKTLLIMDRVINDGREATGENINIKAKILGISFNKKD